MRLARSEISDIARGILSKQRTTMALIRLRECRNGTRLTRVCWTHVSLLVLSWGGSIMVKPHCSNFRIITTGCLNFFCHEANTCGDNLSVLLLFIWASSEKTCLWDLRQGNDSNWPAQLMWLARIFYLFLFIWTSSEKTCLWDLQQGKTPIDLLSWCD